MLFRISCLFLILGCVLLSCKPEDKSKILCQSGFEDILEARYNYLLKYPADSLSFPRSYSSDNNEIKKVPSKDWTSGFFAGNLWQIYRLTGNKAFKEKAIDWTNFIEKEKFNDVTHDMGFKVFCSFGNGLAVNQNQNYKDIMVTSAKTLISRYDSIVGSIRSWDFNKDKWQFPVIIDNMMNLELLFEATKISEDSMYYNVAVSHANTTLKNHFRQDNSTWHVLDYDTITGEVRNRVTHQGFADDSAWARGQAWAINGFTIAYRYTKDKKYLDQVIKTTDFFINNLNLPEDGIPYWDFSHPEIPNISRDVSAGVIVASALVELYEYTGDENYLDYSKKVTCSLLNGDYVLPKDLEIPFILDHSFGDWSKKDEMDEPIVYGDYYFLQTLLRLRDL